MGNKKLYSIRAGLDMRPESRFYQVLSETEETFVIDMNFGNKPAQRQYEIRKDSLYLCEDILHQPMLGDDIEKLKEEWDRAVKKETVNVVAKLTKLMINAQPQGKENATPTSASVNDRHGENTSFEEKSQQATPKRNRQPNFTSPASVESGKVEKPTVIQDTSPQITRFNGPDSQTVPQPKESAMGKPAAEIEAPAENKPSPSEEEQKPSWQKSSNHRQQLPQEALLPRNIGTLDAEEKANTASPEAEQRPLTQNSRANEPQKVEVASQVTAQKAKGESDSVVSEGNKESPPQRKTTSKPETENPSDNKGSQQQAEGEFPRACRLSWEEIDDALNRWVAKVFPTETHVLPHAEMETSDAYSAGWSVSLMGLRSDERALMELILGAHDVRKEINLNKEWPVGQEQDHNITLSQLISEHLMGSEILPSLKKPFTFGVSISMADSNGVTFISND